MKTVLITGGYGFLGRNTAKAFNKNGYTVLGIGHGKWEHKESLEWGFNEWYSSDISLEALNKVTSIPDVIVHCGGSGSVGYSIDEPYQDFKKTVDSTAAVLEYIRIANPNAKIIYPSSPAVHGIHDDKPIKINEAKNPVSPYGVHKLVAEELCKSYRNNFDLDINIVRFFSIYGPGLRKQLLWDACRKFTTSNDEVVFWGDGEETRDWIYIDDAVSLILILAMNCEAGLVLNAGSGIKFTIKNSLNILNKILKTNKAIKFNGKCRAGDPRYYWADISSTVSIGWRPKYTFEEGLKIYVEWFKAQQ